MIDEQYRTFRQRLSIKPASIYPKSYMLDARANTAYIHHTTLLVFLSFELCSCNIEREEKKRERELSRTADSVDID